MRNEGSLARIRLNEGRTKTSLEVNSTTFHDNETESSHVARICELGGQIQSKVGWFQLESGVRSGAPEIFAFLQFSGPQIDHFKHV